MSLNKLFIFFSISFLFGVFVGNILFSFELIFLFFVFIVMFFISSLFLLKKHHFFVPIIVFGIFLGGIHSSINNKHISDKELIIKKYLDNDVYIKAKVNKLYKKNINYNSYILESILINGNNENIKFLLKVNKNLELKKNQIIGFKAKVLKIKNFSSNFNYIRFMQSKDIYFFINYPKNIEFLGQEKLNNLEKFIIDFRQAIINTIYSIYPKNEAVFLAGILIGAREDIPNDMNQNFNNSGLAHLMAVSGFNITIIIIFLGFLFKFLPVYIRFILISLFIIFFTLIVGDNPPVIRASIMGIIGYYILISGRKAHSLSLILITALIMILYNPLYLNYDISFHLSFLAVIGILYFQEFYQKIFKFLPSFFAIKESFVLTLRAMTTTLPIMIFNFGQFSLFAPIANMLVGGIIPFAMFFGTLSILGNFINNYIGFLVGYITYFLLKFVNEVARFFGGLDFSIIKLDLGFYSLYLQILYFMILIFLIIYFRQEKNPKM